MKNIHVKEIRFTPFMMHHKLDVNTRLILKSSICNIKKIFSTKPSCQKTSRCTVSDAAEADGADEFRFVFSLSELCRSLLVKLDVHHGSLISKHAKWISNICLHMHFLFQCICINGNIYEITKCKKSHSSCHERRDNKSVQRATP